MTLQEAEPTLQEYEARFDNFDEIGIPALFQDERFISLLRHAAARGRPLTKSEIDAVIPDVPWDF